MTRTRTSSKQIVVRTTQFVSRPFACAMQRERLRAVACCGRVFVSTLSSRYLWRSLATGFLLAAPLHAHADPFGSTLRWPLATPPGQLRGGFGEPRAGHFHAGLDLSTGGKVGAEVLAPAAGEIERVRTSGVGYGRCLYLRTADRLLVFGHLDSFAPAIAAYADSAQRATGSYEQDLSPPPGMFRFAAGRRIAGSGESGAGPPQSHAATPHGGLHRKNAATGPG